jgi:pimeloyl-ACP methyl ester carboxylesterase
MDTLDAAQGRFAREDVMFASGDGQCAAWLYRPYATEPPPVIVMAHGFAAVRDLRLDAYAERFVAAGYAVLVFDYRHFGASPGEPRQLLSIPRQHEDWRSAVAHARTLDRVDRKRVIAWGTSLAGGHVLHSAARDHDIAAVIVQVPHVSGPASTLYKGPLHALRLTIAGVHDLVRAVAGRSPRYLPAAGDLGTLSVMVAQDGLQMLYRLAEASRPLDDEDRARLDAENRVTARSLLQMPFYSPGRNTHKITAPTLVQIATQDILTPTAAAQRAAQSIPNVEINTYNCGHFDPYIAPHFEGIITDQLDFLKRTVPAG